MERWLTQGPEAERRPAGDGVCANVEFPPPRRLAATRSPRPPASRPTPTRGCPSGWSGRCWRSSTTAWSEPWLREPCRAPRGRSRTARAGFRPPPPPRRPARPLRAAPARAAARLGARRRRPAMPARRALAGRAVARLRQRIGTPDPAERLAAACGAPARTSPALVDLPARALAVRADPAAGRAPRTSCARWPPGATSTSSCCTRRRRCGSASRPTGRRSCAAPTTARRPAGQPAARLVGPRRPRAAARRRARRPSARDHHHAVAQRAGTLLARLQADVRDDRRAAERLRSPRRRPQRAGPRLPRPRAPGRGAPRRDPPPARGRPHARAARRDRDVPGHRELRAAHPGDVRRASGRRDEALPAELHPPDLRVRLADRSLRQTNPLLGVVAAAARSRRRAGDGLAGARPRRPRAGPPPLPARRRRPRADRATGSPASGIRWGLDAAHRAAVQARRAAPPAPGARGSTGCSWA